MQVIINEITKIVRENVKAETIINTDDAPGTNNLVRTS